MFIIVIAAKYCHLILNRNLITAINSNGIDQLILMTNWHKYCLVVKGRNKEIEKIKRISSMMINVNYSEQIAHAKTQGASQVEFKRSGTTQLKSSPNQDTLTLSNQALSLINGDKKIVTETSPIYLKPQSAAALIAEHENSNSTTRRSNEGGVSASSTKGVKFEEMMQAIIDKRLGIDRKKLEEIEALMKEIAEDQNLSPEAKENALKEIEKMRDNIIEESIEIKKTAKQTFTEPTEKSDV